MRKVTKTFQEYVNQFRIRPENGRKTIEEIDELLEQIYYTKERLCASVEEINTIVNGVDNA